MSVRRAVVCIAFALVFALVFAALWVIGEATTRAWPGFEGEGR